MRVWECQQKHLCLFNLNVLFHIFVDSRSWSETVAASFMCFCACVDCKIRCLPRFRLLHKKHLLLNEASYSVAGGWIDSGTYKLLDYSNLAYIETQTYVALQPPRATWISGKSFWCCRRRLCIQRQLHRQIERHRVYLSRNLVCIFLVLRQ